MPKYRDWLKAEQTNINPAGTPVIVRPNETVGAGYAALTMMNDKIRNTPETARGGYSAFATPTEQARVNAAQQKEKAVPASKPSSYLGIEQPPALSEIADPRLIPTALPKGYSYAEYAPSPYDGTPQAPVARATAPSLPSAAPGAVPQYQKYARSGYTAKQGYESVAPFADPTAKAAPATVPASATIPAIGSTFSFANLDDASKAKLKQNNPAFYNQLLVQGIISPMAEDEKPANVSTATAPKTDAESTSTGETGATGTDETEPTGYAKYLAMHPEYAEADRRAEAEYARSLPTYGALAERMAQAGIHGGFSDYLQGVAYAQMQNAKQQNEEAARAGYAALTGNGGVEGTTNAQIGAMYEMFGKGGYTDAEGNTVQGYNLLEIVNDEDYENAKARARADAINQGADEATVDAALKRVDEMRGTVKGQIQTGVSDKMTKYNEGKLEPADLIAAIGYTPSEGEDESVAFLSALDYAVENKLISPEQRSEALKVGLSLYGDKPSAKDVLKSIKTAIDLNDEGAMTDEDKNAVLEDALKAVETYFKGKKWTVKIENGKLYAKNKAGEWEDLGNLKYKSEFETIIRGSYYDDVVKLVYENRNKK